MAKDKGSISSNDINQAFLILLTALIEELKLSKSINSERLVKKIESLEESTNTKSTAGIEMALSFFKEVIKDAPEEEQ